MVPIPPVKTLENQCQGTLKLFWQHTVIQHLTLYFILSPVFSSWIKIWLLSTYNTLQVLAFDLYRNADSFLKTTWNILSPHNLPVLMSCPVEVDC